LAAAMVLIAAGTSAVRAQEAWLVTYGPGEEVWEMFGHNALWLRDPAVDLDHTYSFGYFEIDRAGFYFDFARGVMNYYGASGQAEREFEFYRQRGRSISAQKLALEPAEVRALHQSLHEAIYPHPQFYAYDYFRANCSTWLRDLINRATGDQLRPFLLDQPARQTYLGHTLRMTHHRPWIQTGLSMLMGPSIDRPMSAWEESFLPEALAQWLDETALAQGPLVAERITIHDPGVFEAPEQPRRAWLMLVSLGLGLGLLILFLVQRDEVWGAGAWRVGALLAGLSGSLLLLMMLATDHRDTHWNLACLLLNPFWLLLLAPLPAHWGRVLRYLLLLATLLGAIVLAWPGLIQDRPGLVVLLLPLLGATLWGSWREASGRWLKPS